MDMTNTAEMQEPAPQKSLSISFSAFSHQGLVRTTNEDSYRMDEQNRFAIIADGMGGHAAGEIASKMAVEIVGEEIIIKQNKLTSLLGAKNENELVDEFIAIVNKANVAIFSSSSKNPEHQGMGTTLDAVISFASEAYVLHVGDTRVYQVRNSQIVQITLDHSLAAVLVETGKANADQAKDYSNILLRALGTNPEIEIDIYRLDLEPGDTILICSDGVWEYYPTPDEMKEMIVSGFQDSASRLVLTAIDRGGKDNATALVMSFGSDSR